MKSKIILILLLACLIQSCDKNNDQVIPGPDGLKDLQLQMGRDSVPLSLLATHKKAVFVNSAGEEKILNLEYKAGEITKSVNSQSYKTEYERINYSDTTGSGLWMIIDVQIQYNDDASTIEVINITLSPASTQSLWSSIFLTSNPTVFPTRFLPSLTIAGINFTNVYADNGDTFPPGDSFTDIFYNTALGIVGFEGNKGEMWALKRYE